MRFIIVRGVAGSGKTTYVKKNFPNMLHIETDMLCMQDGKYNWNKTLSDRRHKCARDIVKLALDMNADVVVSNTFIRKWELDQYINMVPIGYDIKVYRMCSWYGSTHDVPKETIIRMTKTFEDYDGEILVE
jgi:predicted ABC-type ATPase